MLIHWTVPFRFLWCSSCCIFWQMKRNFKIAIEQNISKFLDLLSIWITKLLDWPKTVSEVWRKSYVFDDCLESATKFVRRYQPVKNICVWNSLLIYSPSMKFNLQMRRINMTLNATCTAELLVMTVPKYPRCSLHHRNVNIDKCFAKETKFQFQTLKWNRRNSSKTPFNDACFETTPIDFFGIFL